MNIQFPITVARCTIQAGKRPYGLQKAFPFPDLESATNYLWDQLAGDEAPPGALVAVRDGDCQGAIVANAAVEGLGFYFVRGAHPDHINALFKLATGYAEPEVPVPTSETRSFPWGVAIVTLLVIGVALSYFLPG